MKFAAIASTVAALVAVSNAASCDVTSLQTLLTSSDTTTCASDSGYTVTSLATPTDAQMSVMCTSKACQSVLTQLETLAPSECTLGTFALYADLITPLKAHCSGSSSTSGTTAGSSATTATVGSTAGSSTSATVTASSTGSAADTTTPATSTTSSGSSTSQTATSSSAASASTSGSSGASMATVSAGAVLVAVAATFF